MKNEGLIDRILRFIFGVVCFIIGFVYFENGWKYAFYFVGIVLVITAITGYCGAYKLFHVSSIKKKELKKKFIKGKEETSM